MNDIQRQLIYDLINALSDCIGCLPDHNWAFKRAEATLRRAREHEDINFSDEYQSATAKVDTMTVRDQFAMATLAASTFNAHELSAQHERIARTCYDLADAMLKVRNVRYL